MELDSKKAYFENYYHRMADRLFRFVLLRVGDREAALDLTEETFFKFWQALLADKQIQSENALLFTIARNKVIDWYRKKRPESLDSMIEAALDEDREPIQVIDETACEEMRISVEASAVIRDLQKLPPQYREILQMRFVDDLSIEEMAEILQISTNAVSLRVHHGIQKLRKKLGIDLENENDKP